jgi:hypothetical protein
MADDHGIACECGDTFDSVEALQIHMNSSEHVSRLDNALENSCWDVINAQVHGGEHIYYFDLELKKEATLSGPKVGAITVSAIKDAGYKINAWYPGAPEVEYDGVYTVRVWVEDMR